MIIVYIVLLYIVRLVSEMHFPKQPHPKQISSQVLTLGFGDSDLGPNFRIHPLGKRQPFCHPWCFNKDVALATTLVTIPDHNVEGVVEKVELTLG